MIVHETANHQMTVKFKFLQLPLRTSIMNQSPYILTGAVKDPEVQNVKLFIKHDNRLHLLKKWWTNKNKWLIKQQPLERDLSFLPATKLGENITGYVVCPVLTWKRKIRVPTMSKFLHSASTRLIFTNFAYKYIQIDIYRIYIEISSIFYHSFW